MVGSDIDHISAGGYGFRARALLWLGDLDQALSDADTFASLEPGEAYAVRGDVFWARGDLQRAESDYRLCLRLRPDDPKISSKLASVHEAQAVAMAAPGIASSVDLLDLVDKLAALRDSGAITDDEFQAKKAELLGRI